MEAEEERRHYEGSVDFDAGRTLGFAQVLAYLNGEIGKERLCPSRARMTDWNRTLRRMVDELEEMRQEGP